jgi:glutamyl-tRNA synthetase
MPLIQERAKTLADVAELTKFFFVDKLDYKEHPPIGKDMDAAASAKALDVSWQRLQALETFDEASLEVLLRPLAEELGLKTGQLFGTLRVASTAEIAAPPLFQTMAVLGKEQCLRRIKSALDRLSAFKG